MGIFSKIWKGVKTGVKSIGKGIKSAFKKFGKFMNKIGVLGQIAMMFILPGIGQALGSMWTGIAGQTAAQGVAAANAASLSATAGATAAGATASAAATAGATAAAGISTAASGLAGYTGAMSGAINAAGNVMRFVSSTVGKAGTVFNNITQGVTETLGNFAKTAGKKLGFKGEMFTNAADNFFTAGKSATGTVTDTAFSRSFGDASRFGNITESQSFFTARDEQYQSAFKATADDAGKVDFKKPELKADLPETSQRGGFQNMSADSNIDIGTEYNINDPLAEYTDIQVSDLGGEISNKELIDQGFSFKGVEGSVEFQFGDRKVYATADTLSTMDNSRLFERFQTGNMRGSAFSEGIKDLGQNFLDLPKNMYNEGKSFLSNPLEGSTSKLQNKAVTRVAQELGIEEKPVYNQYAFSAAVPTFQTADVGTYGAPELMDSRSFEQQVSNNPMAFGYTAFQYNGYMNQTNQYANTTV